MQALSARHRSFALDLWGFGDSSKAEEMYSLESYTEMIDQFTDQLGIVTPVTLVGHAMGAAVALRFSISQPEKVEKVVAVSLPLNGADIDGRLTSLDPDSFVSRVVGKSNSFSEIDSELRKTDQRAMNGLASELTALDVAAELDQCTCPLLTVFGDEDAVVQPPTNSYELLHNVDKHRFYVTLNQCNHFPMLQEKAKFNRLLLDFIHADESLTELAPKEYWQRRVR